MAEATQTATLEKIHMLIASLSRALLPALHLPDLASSSPQLHSGLLRLPFQKCTGPSQVFPDQLLTHFC